MVRQALIAGSLLGFLSVAAGAFGAHGLRELLPADRLAIFETGVRYAMFHATGLLATGLLAIHRPSPALRRATLAFVAGAVLFSGSLVALALTGVRALGAITPLGGLSFLAGWLFVASAAARLPPIPPDARGPGNSSG